jgi:hypothetical protein
MRRDRPRTWRLMATFYPVLTGVEAWTARPCFKLEQFMFLDAPIYSKQAK